MPKKKKSQLALFDTGDHISVEDFKKIIPKKRLQHEKKFMKSIQEIATSLSLPSIHVQNFCGNTFNCPHCGKPVQCHSRNNKHLSGHFDLIGISWVIETKHATNKIKKQSPKLSNRQGLKKFYYDSLSVPYFVSNEHNADECFKFLNSLKKD